MFRQDDKYVLIEFDGVQHFQQIPFFDSTHEIFINRQERDIEKTKNAYVNGYYLIRIDYTQINSIDSHIVEALKLFTQGYKIYLSSPDKYKFLM